MGLNLVLIFSENVLIHRLKFERATIAGTMVWNGDGDVQSETFWVPSVIYRDDDTVPNLFHRSETPLIDNIIQACPEEIHPYDVETIISVHRHNVWGMAKISFGRKKFNSRAPLRVNFFNYSDMDEGAIDQGGPQKEMFTLCLKGMLEGRCFVGRRIRWCCQEMR